MGSGTTAELARDTRQATVRPFEQGDAARGTGSYDVKHNWEFIPTPLEYESRLLKRGSIPQNNPRYPKYRAMIARWKHIARSLG
jgi:hypothetical protein